ncbi:NUDIX domain-containing protein [Octadecabacter sp. CECT 8868]|uniref:NUDIX domain-containing protein n=1 Tax=Octadecabacter algicola TaxID=2909342 RepID=UPI001F188986|nr:NUDIX domain-containing protein [Octadecabacter algicola]MCF2904157.1 NUDIX domain-containing protein [Octadecabacter algicola]
MDLFLFGTLLHMPLLEVVSGDSQVRERVTFATRVDFKVSRVEGQVFPIMHEAKGSVAEGVIVSGLSDEALSRLDYYEKAFGYERMEFVVLDADQQPREATAYLPEPGLWSPAESWDRDGWITAMGELTTLTAREAMSGIDHTPAEAMGRRYRQMMARAASHLRAKNTAHNAAVGRGDMVQGDVTLLKSQNRYAGFFNVEEVDLAFRRFDGAMSAPVNRAVFVGVDATIVLPYDPVRDRVLLVEQFRTGAYLRGDANPWTIEPVAGIIDPGETPEEAAIREAKEEAGITLRDLTCVSAAYPSPGTTTEHFYLYVGLCDLPDGAEGRGGEDAEDEDIQSYVMDWVDFDEALNAGKFRLLPLLVVGHWLARNRDRLRAAA